MCQQPPRLSSLPDRDLALGLNDDYDIKMLTHLILLKFASAQAFTVLAGKRLCGTCNLWLRFSAADTCMVVPRHAASGSSDDEDAEEQSQVHRYQERGMKLSHEPHGMFN
eukprot:SAG25_NODE_24_length_22161_cov_23.692405_9_plen_110_part_00